VNPGRIITSVWAWVKARGERFNPVVVKEFRQAVRSRFVIAVLMLFLLVDLLVMGAFLLLSADTAANADAGRNVFMTLLVILIITCVGFVPLYSGVRLSLERNDANIDLLYITTVSPGAIIRGKYFTAMALTLLIFSASAPFLVLTYLLRGIDIPTIGYALSLTFLVCAAANAMGIFAGCVPGSWFGRGLAALGMLILLLWTIVMTIGWIERTLMFGRGMMSGRSPWAELGTMVLLELLAVGLFHVLSVAIVSPKPANRMLIPRVYVTVAWAVSGIVFYIWSLVESNCGPMVFWLILSTIVLAGFAVLALGERDAWGRRIRATIPHNPPVRLLAFLFYTGSAGGLAWATLLFGATLVVCLGPSPTFGLSLHQDLATAAGNSAICFGYILCYCLTAAIFRMLFLKRLSTIHMPPIAMLLGVAACLLPYLLAFFFLDSSAWWREDSNWFLLGGPMVLTTSRGPSATAAGPVVIGWLLIALLLSVEWWGGQFRRFKGLRAEPSLAVSPLQLQSISADEASVGGGGSE
jgi:hypothetical protein